MSVGTFLYYLKLLAVCKEIHRNVIAAFECWPQCIFSLVLKLYQM